MIKTLERGEILFKKKIIFKCLAITLLLNLNKGSVFASERYESFSGEDIFVNENTQLKPLDIEVSGATLVSPMKNTSFAQYINATTKRLENGKVINNKTSGVSTDNNYYMIDENTKKFLTLKRNTTYTVFISGKIRFDESNNYRRIVPFYRTFEEDGRAVTKVIKDISVSHDNYFNESISFTTEDKEIQSFGFYVSTASTIVDEVDVYYHVVEGNVADKNIPYFEGVKSVGQHDNLKNQITLSSQNKNISTELEYGFYDEFGQEVGGNDTSHYRSKNLIRVNPGDKLVYSNMGIERGINVLYFDINKNFMFKRNITSPIIDIPKNCYYIKYFHYSSDSERLQMEHGDRITSYVEPLLNQVKVNLKEPLRSLPNGVKDRIIKKDGQWVVERNCAEVTLTEESILRVRNHNEVNVDRVELNIDSFKGIKVGDYWMHTIPPEAVFEAVSWKPHSDNTNNVWKWFHSVHQSFHIVCPKGTTLEEAKVKLLNTNVVYQLETPIYEPLNVESVLNIYEDRFIIRSDSQIPANINITVDRTINLAKKNIEIAKLNPTIDNISQARYWINLIDNSILKDQLQSEISNITNIDDLQLEKKTVTANIDLYIKSENTLTMSLSTNSIMFDDFGGTEDMEKLGCLDIQISSSLPYDLNAYLVDELYNSDKSKIMDKEILNIKESSQSNYNLFTGINNKLILKANNSAGNFINHSIDLRLRGGITHDKDVYKTVIKFEAEQK